MEEKYDLTLYRDTDIEHITHHSPSLTDVLDKAIENTLPSISIEQSIEIESNYPPCKASDSYIEYYTQTVLLLSTQPKTVIEEVLKGLRLQGEWTLAYHIQAILERIGIYEQ